MLRNVIVDLLLSAIAILVATIGFIVLFIAYGNPEVGFWSILSGVVATVCFHLHWVKGKETLERWHSKITLKNLNFLGFITAVAGFTGMIWYIFLTLYYKIPVQPISESTEITAVWCMICGKWGVLLMYYSHKYELLIQDGTAPILTESGA